MRNLEHHSKSNWAIAPLSTDNEIQTAVVHCPLPAAIPIPLWANFQPCVPMAPLQDGVQWKGVSHMDLRTMPSHVEPDVWPASISRDGTDHQKGEHEYSHLQKTPWQARGKKSPGRNAPRACPKLFATLLRELESEYEDRILTLRINRLGFDCASILRQHFEQIAPVCKILLSQAHEKPKVSEAVRLRPAAMCLVLFENAEDAAFVLAKGEHQVVHGVEIIVRAFDRDVAYSSVTGNGRSDETKPRLFETQLTEVESDNHDRILVLRKLNRLGNDSAAILQQHFVQIASICKMVFLHTHEKPDSSKAVRLRPSSTCLVLLESADGAAFVLAQCERQLVHGVEVIVRALAKT